MGRRDAEPWWQCPWTERLAILLAVAVLHVAAIAWLVAPPKQPGKRPPVAGWNKPMQLVWIPREPLQAANKREPSTLPAADSVLAPNAAPGVGVSRLPSEVHSDLSTDEPNLAADAAAPGWDARRDLLGIPALVRSLPAGDGARSPHGGEHFSGGRDAIRLPDDGPRKVEGIFVRDQVSLDQRVQGALALVGLGRIDPCPDIRSQLRSAVARGDPQEVQHWINRERYCR